GPAGAPQTAEHRAPAEAVRAVRFSCASNPSPPRKRESRASGTAVALDSRLRGNDASVQCALMEGDDRRVGELVERDGLVVVPREWEVERCKLAVSAEIFRGLA